MGITPFQSGDTLRQPAFYDAGKLAVFDVVLANPPFSVEKWGEEVWASDPWQRNFAGLPPSSSGDFAWVQHMVTSMAPKTGRMTVVLPLGALFHSGVESAIRRKLLERDLIDTVIALGPNLFYGTGVPAAIIVARMKRPDGESGRVFFVDGSYLFNELRNQNELHRPHAEAILRLVSDRSVVEGTSRFVTHEEIKSNGWSLFPALYLWDSNALDYASKGQMKPPKALAASVRDAQAAAEAVREAERRLSDLLGGDT